MTRIAPLPPAESDLLCEFCGYTLNGLSEQSNCPECGMPIAASLGEKRHPPRWEEPGGEVLTKSFVLDTATEIIFQPTYFFKNVTTRGDVARASVFGKIHWALASILFGFCGAVHSSLFNSSDTLAARIFVGPGGVLIFAAVAYLGLWGTTWLAVRLTAWEAAYRGYRLPIPVVSRAMYYHAAHYLPVALLATATVIGYWGWRHHDINAGLYIVKYLYIIAVEIIIAAAYLFKTYWIGMRNMMYANV